MLNIDSTKKLDKISHLVQKISAMWMMDLKAKYKTAKL
jgi:hypothetical protein